MDQTRQEFVEAVIVRNIVARFVARVGMGHATPEALKKYLKEHPNADKANHTVEKPGEISSEGGSAVAESEGKKGQKRFEENKKTLSDMQALKKKVENADSGAAKKFDRAYDKLFDAGEDAAKAAKKLLQKHPDGDAFELLEGYLREWDRNKMDHVRAKGGLASAKMQQAENTYGYAQQLESVVKDFHKFLKDPDTEIDSSWRK